MTQRLEAEIELLRRRHAGLRHGERHDWVLVPDFLLPRGRFAQDQTDLLILIPAGYPLTPPDDFFVRGDLQLRGGGTPPAFNVGPNSSSGIAPVEGNWGWFSWHATSWRPAAAVGEGDNLLSYLRSVSACMRADDL